MSYDDDDDDDTGVSKTSATVTSSSSVAPASVTNHTAGAGGVYEGVEHLHVDWVQELPEDLDVCIAQRDFEAAVDLIQKSIFTCLHYLLLRTEACAYYWYLSHSLVGVMF